MNVALLTMCAALFWQQSREDARPAPRPTSVPTVPLGEIIPLRDSATQSLLESAGFTLVGGTWVRADGSETQSKPTLFHFANPDCPCSQFMEDHVWMLYKQFRDRLRFVAVLPSEDQSSYRDGLLGSQPGFQVVSDPEGHLARAMGVYATPTAVLLDGDHQLVYRGNYNQGRFCVVESSQYARQAIEAFLAGRRDFQPPPQALSSIGCLLPIFREEETLPKTDDANTASRASGLASEDSE